MLGSGSGPYDAGSIEITSIDESHVVFTLSGTGPFFGFDQNVDGTFVAARCRRTQYDHRHA